MKRLLANIRLTFHRTPEQRLQVHFPTSSHRHYPASPHSTSMAPQKITHVFVVTTSPMEPFAGKIIGIYASKDLAGAAATDGRLVEPYEIQFADAYVFTPRLRSERSY